VPGSDPLEIEFAMVQPQASSTAFERRDIRLSQQDVAVFWQRADESVTRTYRMCGRVLRLRCDSGDYASRFEDAFRRLRLDAEPGSDPLSEITFLTRQAGPDGFPALLDRQNGRARVFSCDAVRPTQLFFCLAFIEKQMFPLTDHIILHGSVVQHGGKVTALLGLTNSGKSTLGLRLALEEGIAFLSDEFCPICITDGSVEPFPRCLGLRQRARGFLVEMGAIAPQTDSETAAQIEMDPLCIRGLVLGQRGLLHNVILLAGNGESVDSGVRLLDLQFVNAGVVADLESIPGVRAVCVLKEPVGSGISVRIETREGARVTEELIRVCRGVHKMELFGFLPPQAKRPNFTDPPSLVPLQPLQGILAMVRHLVNFHVLESRFARSYSALVDCLAARLGCARFFSLRPGPLEESARLVLQQVLGA
jgi:hypothetical protein